MSLVNWPTNLANWLVNSSYHLISFLLTYKGDGSGMTDTVTVSCCNCGRYIFDVSSYIVWDNKRFLCNKFFRRVFLDIHKSPLNLCMYLGCDFFEHVHMYACTHFNFFWIFSPCVSLCEVLFFGWVYLLSTCPHKTCFFAHVRVCTLENDYRSTCLHFYMLHRCIFSPKNMHPCNMWTCTQIDKTCTHVEQNCIRGTLMTASSAFRTAQK